MPKQWTRGNFILHALLATVVILQLISIVTYNAGVPAAIIFHKYEGVFVFLVATSFLLHQLFQPNHKIIDWFPWLTSNGLRTMISDLKILCCKRLPERASGGGLAGTIHGLGLLLVLALSLDGTLFLINQKWGNAALAHQLIHLHATYAFLIWWYLGGHLFMAFLHKVVDRQYIVEC